MASRKNMGEALRRSMDAEDGAFAERLRKAETLFPDPARVAAADNVAVPYKPEPPRALRRTFSLTNTEYALLLTLKRRCNYAGFESPQSELVRAGLYALAALDDDRFKERLNALEKLKAGRPANP